MYGPASYLGCIWSFGFQANYHLRVNLELRFLDAIGEQVLSYSASIPMDQFDRASYDFTSWYLCVVFLLVRESSKEWERMPLPGEGVARQDLEEDYPGLSASAS